MPLAISVIDRVDDFPTLQPLEPVAVGGALPKLRVVRRNDSVHDFSSCYRERSLLEASLDYASILDSTVPICLQPPIGYRQHDL